MFFLLGWWHEGAVRVAMEALALVGDLALDVIDDDDLQRCKKIFTFYDEDRDGKLTYAELLICVRSCGRNPSIDEFKEMVTIIDTKLVRTASARHSLFRFSSRLNYCSQDGALDFEDFMSLYVMQLKDGPNNEAEMLEAFQAFDKGGNGFIMADDLKQVREGRGLRRHAAASPCPTHS